MEAYAYAHYWLTDEAVASTALKPEILAIAAVKHHFPEEQWPYLVATELAHDSELLATLYRITVGPKRIWKYTEGRR